MAPDDDDPKVKEILGTETQADLERWFSLPSFQQVEEEQAEEAVDEEMQAKIERRDKALTAVDPALVTEIHARTDENPRTLIQFAPTIDVRVDENIGNVDHALVARVYAITEPRIYELPDLESVLKECTPQALLRDLHRPELDFQKQFESVDMSAEQRLDIVEEVAAAMTASWKLPPLVHPLDEFRRTLADLRAAQRRPWTEYLPHLLNRRVSE